MRYGEFRPYGTGDGHNDLFLDLGESRVRRQAAETIEKANRDIERAQRKLEMIEKLGEVDEYPNETVLFFKKKFLGNPKKYDYIAFKVVGKWYLSGPTNAGKYFNWGSLLDFVIGTNSLDDIEIWEASEWTRVL